MDFDKIEYKAGKIVSLIRSGEMVGSFSEGCDCEKCNKYARKIRNKIIKILKSK